MSTRVKVSVFIVFIWPTRPIISGFEFGGVVVGLFLTTSLIFSTAASVSSLLVELIGVSAGDWVGDGVAAKTAEVEARIKVMVKIYTFII